MQKHCLSLVEHNLTEWSLLQAYLALFDTLDNESVKALNIKNRVSKVWIAFRSDKETEEHISAWIRKHPNTLENELKHAFQQSYHGQKYWQALSEQGIVQKPNKASMISRLKAKLYK